jgi:probable HAF family extracellular repeat protein
MSIASLERLGAVALVFGSVAGTDAQAATYHIIDLGVKYNVSGISDRGELAGWSNITQTQAAVLRQGRWRQLPDHGEPSTTGAINAGGDVTGWVHYRTGFWPRGGAFVRLPMPADSVEDGFPTGISDRQVVVGYYRSTVGQEQSCFRWSAEEGSVELGFMGQGDYCFASAINDAGQIAGYGDTEAFGVAHSFIYTNGVFQDIGTIDDGYDTYASGINRQGHVVGTTATYSSFLWKDGQMIDLRVGSPYNMIAAGSINDRDEIVGQARDGWGVWHAVRWADGHFTDLETEVDALHDWQLEAATAVNNLGMIVGFGFRTGDQRDHSFMLVPISKP